MLGWAGDYAVWAGLYAVGVLGMLTWIAEEHPPPLAWVFVFLCAQAGYLFDRVKLTRSRMDPSDAISQPRRFLTLLRHDRGVRAVIAAELIAAGVIGWWIWAPLTIVPAGVVAVIWWYAGRPADPARPRPKDWAYTKGLFIASAHTMLGVGPLLSPASDPHPVRLILGLVVLAGLVFADAILCDLDDRDADATYGTMTIPVRAGRRGAWVVATVSYACAALAGFAVLPVPHASLFAGLIFATTLIAACLTHRRDFIDARLVFIALACLLIA